MNPENQLLTLREVAVLLRTSPRTVSGYSRAGLLPVVRLNSKRLLYPRVAVEAFLTSHTVQGRQS